MSTFIHRPVQGNILSVHILQSFSDVLLNRGERGEAKTLTFGGTKRVRVSTQAWNRSTRKLVRRELQALDQGQVVTTRRLPAQIAEHLSKFFGMDPAIAVAYGHAVTEAAGVATDPQGNGNSRATLVLSRNAIFEMAQVAGNHQDEFKPLVEKMLGVFKATADKKASKKEKSSEAATVEDTKTADVSLPLSIKKHLRRALDSSGEIDLSLFGRFIAELPEWSVSSAVHSGNAITVQPASINTDYFSLVDDILAESGLPSTVHVGTTEFTSGTFYRNAYLDRGTLRKNLSQGFADKNDPAIDQLQEKAEELFVQAFIKSVPSSKSTRTSSNTLPFFVLVTDSDHPVNGQQAFLKALDQDIESVEEESVISLLEYLDSVAVLAPIHSGTVFSPRVPIRTSIGATELKSL